MTASRLSFEHVGEIVTVFRDAFYDYPVMRYVLGPAEPYDERLGRLVDLFVSGRACRGEPMLGVRDPDGTLVGVATMTLPRQPDPPATFLALRESIWAELGADARSRYDAFVAATQQFAIEPSHYHLNMIGVRRSHQGRGVARVLLQAVHELSSSDNLSWGVSLTTELAGNVRLYEHFGYRVHGRAPFGDGLKTWILFRPDVAPPSSSSEHTVGAVMEHPPFEQPPPGDDRSSEPDSFPTEESAESTSPPPKPPVAIGAGTTGSESRSPGRSEGWPGAGRPVSLPPALVRAVDRVLDVLDDVADRVREIARRDAGW